MAKNKNIKKYYAIKEGKNNTKNKIVETWNECKELVHGYPAVYKSFLTIEECNEYLKIVNPEKVKEQAKKGIEQRNIKKAKNKNTKLIQARISEDMYKDLENKSKETNLKIDQLLKFALTQYLY